MRHLVDTAGSVWLFGYGSLVWRQDFPHQKARPGHVRGWERRFWQGSHDHRGAYDDPGRVATVVEKEDGRCHERAFLIDVEAFERLDKREINGYRRIDVEIFFDNSSALGVTYRAPRGNFAFLGDAPIDEMVTQINHCTGRSGHNADYVLELARVLRQLDVEDPHVIELEARIIETQGGYGPEQPGERQCQKFTERTSIS